MRGAIDRANGIVKTHGGSGYDDLREHGAKHQAVVQESPARAATALPWAHIVFSNFEDWLCGTCHGVSSKQLPRSLRELVQRTNRRWLAHDLFFCAVRRAVQGEPFTRTQISAEATE